MTYNRINLRTVNTRVRNLEVSFKDTPRLNVLNSENIRDNLMGIVTLPGTHLTLNLKGVCFIDSKAFDDLNHLSRVARNYNSVISLSNVESSVMELIDLVKKYRVLDIKAIKPIQKSAQVA